MENIKVLIVDDEPIAQEIIESYLQKITGLELIGCCKNALEAYSIISRQKIDLIFLDINMPEISGMDFLKTLRTPPKVVFTTAYPQYAVESYELNAIDYLLKPVSFERFLKATNKAIAELQTTGNQHITETAPAQAKVERMIFVKSEGKHIRVDLEKVSFIEGLKDYIQIWLDNERVIVHTTMKGMEEQLNRFPEFIRVHKSYIVNTKFIMEVWGNTIKTKNHIITVGSTYRDELNKLLESNKLS